MSRKEERVIGLERQMTLRSITKQLEIGSVAILKKCKERFNLLERMLALEIKLTAIYTHEIYLKEQLHAAYEDNMLLDITLLNLPYRALSILSLTKQSLYGPAGDLIRQFLEGLILAKYSEFDKTLTSTWQSGSDVNVGRDVLNKLRKEHVDAIAQFWHEACQLDHATKYSMQPLLLHPLKEEQGTRQKYVEGKVLSHAEYTLDALFALLSMNFHLLISPYGRKAYRWWFGYPDDPLGYCEREKNLKHEFRKLMNRYLEAMRPGARNHWKEIIFQYRRNWKRPESHSSS